MCFRPVIVVLYNSIYNDPWSQVNFPLPKITTEILSAQNHLLLVFFKNFLDATRNFEPETPKKQINPKSLFPLFHHVALLRLEINARERFQKFIDGQMRKGLHLQDLHSITIHLKHRLGAEIRRVLQGVTLRSL